MTTTGIANLTNSNVFRVGQSVCVGTDGSQPFEGELDELDVYEPRSCAGGDFCHLPSRQRG